MTVEKDMGLIINRRTLSLSGAIAALALLVSLPEATGQGSMIVGQGGPAIGQSVADMPAVPPQVRTNLVYSKLEQAEKDGDAVRIADLLPQIEALYPGDAIAYIHSLREAARWAAEQTTVTSSDEALRVLGDRLAAEQMAGRSNSTIGLPARSIKPALRNIELWRIRTNALVSALQKPWPSDSTGAYLAVMQRLIDHATMFAPEDWVRPLLLPLAGYAGRIRMAMVPLAKAGPAVRSGSSLYDSYLSKVAWGTNSVPDSETKGARGMGPEQRRLMEAINNAALADALRKQGDTLALSTANAITNERTGLSAAERRKAIEARRVQDDIRRADAGILEGRLIPLLIRIPATSTENIKFLEQAAAAALLLAEERQKIGLK
jgi:hypothetical protein